MTNIERHASARNVELQLEVGSDFARIAIQDDGIGLLPDAEKQPGHYGMRGMRERVEGLGGELTFISNRPGGTCVDVKLPVL